jgi:hypothetical protein
VVTTAATTGGSSTSSAGSGGASGGGGGPMDPLTLFACTLLVGFVAYRRGTASR